MAEVRVAILGTVGKSVRVNPDATEGATLGVNLFDENGDILTAATLADLLVDDIANIVITEDRNPAVFESEIVDGSILARVASDEIITGAWRFQNAQGIRIYDPGGTDYSQFSHDGVDLNTTFVNTADWNISGITGIDASTVDLSVDALTFATWEGIESADLRGTLGHFGSSYIDHPTVDVTSDGATITLSIEKQGGGDLRVWFTDGVHTHDCTPADTVALTAGTDTAPTLNYIYILQSTLALTASTAGWPATEYAPVATVFCQSAASAQTDGLYKVHVWTDHIDNTHEAGHLSHLNFWIRQQNATWQSGADVTVTDGVATFDIETTAANVLQLHEQSYPTFDTSTGSEVLVVNDFDTPYERVGDLTTILTDANGGSMSGRYFNLVLWGVVSEDSEDCQLMINLPTDSYATEASATSDADETTVYDTPDEFRGTSFLIARLTMRHQAGGGGTWTSVQVEDLRGTLSTGGTAGSAGLSQSDANALYLRLDATNDPVTGQVDFSGGIRIYDAGLTDYAEFSHDGTDLNTTFVNTTDWNISSIARFHLTSGVLLVLDDGLMYEQTALADMNIGNIAQGNQQLFNSGFQPTNDPDGANYWSGIHFRHRLTQDYATQLVTGSASTEPVLFLRHKTDGVYGNWYSATFAEYDETITAAWDFDNVLDVINGNSLRVRDGGGLRILDVGDTDYADFSHDGVDFNTTLVNTTDWNVTGATRIKHDGVLQLQERASAPSDTAGYGQIWVKTATPNELWFTDDAGTDARLGGGGQSLLFDGYSIHRILSNQANAIAWYDNNDGNRTKTGLDSVTQVRLVLRVVTASASANNPRVVIKYRTSDNATASNWTADIGVSEVSCSLSATGIIDTGWINLASGAKIDNAYVGCLMQGGDGVEDPTTSGVTVHFR